MLLVCRALELAQKFKSNVDVVIHCRNQYLDSMKWKESNEKFLQASQGVSGEGVGVGRGTR